MSVQTIIQSLEKLVKLHESLLAISKQKTEIVKSGSIDQLQPLLIKERRHVQALEQVEGQRQKNVVEWFNINKLSSENATITKMLEVIKDEEEAKKLASVTAGLTETITELKQQEELNNKLIQQSMQFVELSLNMMSPSLTNLNYGNKKDTGSVKRSVFDSKA